MRRLFGVEVRNGVRALAEYAYREQFQVSAIGRIDHLVVHVGVDVLLLLKRVLNYVLVDLSVVRVVLYLFSLTFEELDFYNSNFFNKNLSMCKNYGAHTLWNHMCTYFVDPHVHMPCG